MSHGIWVSFLTLSLSCHSVSTGSAEEGVAKGAIASHWAKPPLPAPLHRVSGTARHPEGQVACPDLPQQQQGQGYTLTANDDQGCLSPGQSAVGGDAGRQCAVLHQHQPSSLGGCALCPGPVLASERGSLFLSPGSPCRAEAGVLPFCSEANKMLLGLPSPTRPHGGH